MTNPQTEYDSPWKDIIQRYFEDFILFFFPQAHGGIDWSRGFEFLDQELQSVVRDAELGKRFVDKLVKIYILGGEEAWLLIHVEVESPEEEDFAKRMFSYNYRIFDLYDRYCASLAVLGDDRINSRPSQFSYLLFGCSVDFRFPVVKLIDYQQRLSELESSRNPFATVVLAHLAALETQSDRQKRKESKLALVRKLYEQGFERQEVLDLLAFIDSMLTLPLNLDLEFRREVEFLEARQLRKYMTSFERLARREELLGAIELGLEIKFGTESLTLMTEISQIENLEQLRTIKEQIKTVSNVEELRRIYVDMTEL